MNRRSLMSTVAIAAAAPSAMMASDAAAADAVGRVLVVITHPVQDYAAWRTTYDRFEPVRQAAGVTGAEVFRDPKDANMIVVIHRFPNIEAAQGFLANREFTDVMTKAGVTAPPTTIIAVKP